MIFELPNFVSEDQLNFINSEIEKYYNNPEISKRKESSYRDGKTIIISNHPEVEELDNYLFKIFSSPELLNYLNRRYFPKFETGDTGYEFHRYEPGDICQVHSDGEVSASHGQHNEEYLLRFASIILHLNTPKVGGELIFPSLNKTIKTEAGKIVIFPPYGFAQHYTTESSDPRDVIVTWFVYKNLLVRHR
jgi:hypothetical protein